MIVCACQLFRCIVQDFDKSYLYFSTFTNDLHARNKEKPQTRLSCVQGGLTLALCNVQRSFLNAGFTSTRITHQCTLITSAFGLQIHFLFLQITGFPCIKARLTALTFDFLVVPFVFHVLAS